VVGVSVEVGYPFMVIATHIPLELAGTYRLPEAQLDRFLMKTALGYPDHAATVEILGGRTTRSQVRTVPPMITTGAVVDMAELAGTVHTDPAVLDYVARIAEATRTAPETIVGVSVRGALALVRGARTWAAAHGRHFVIPDDVKDLVEPVLAHRIVLDAEAEFAGTTEPSVLRRHLGEIAPPERRR
jgi:MoxR-like ATPase